jgi:prepilin-type processing-associated H-X9-DG protein
MGQVWSKADFDGRTPFGNHGGRGSVLAVTAQNAGPDGLYGTADDVLAPLNPFPRGVQVSIATSLDNSKTNPNDRVREFASLHPGGANFLMADGSVRWVSQTIDFRVYEALSTIQGGEVVSGDF